jgi:hypothetical protein
MEKIACTKGYPLDKWDVSHVENHVISLVFDHIVMKLQIAQYILDLGMYQT